MAQANDARARPPGLDRAVGHLQWPKQTMQGLDRAVGHLQCFGEGGGVCPLAWAFEDASEKAGAYAPSLGPSLKALGGGEGAQLPSLTG